MLMLMWNKSVNMVGQINHDFFLHDVTKNIANYP